LDNVKSLPHKSKIITPGIYFGWAGEKEKRQEVKGARVISSYLREVLAERCHNRIPLKKISWSA
jgi:hypothetical protein